MTTDADAVRLLRAKEVATILGVHPAKVRELARTGQLRSIRLGEDGWHRFDPRDVERFIAGGDRP